MLQNAVLLFQIRVDLRKYHAYRLFCTNYLLSPVLGDRLYGGRVQTVMGVPVEVDPFSDVANTPQVFQQRCLLLYDEFFLISRRTYILYIYIFIASLFIFFVLREKVHCYFLEN